MLGVPRAVGQEGVRDRRDHHRAAFPQHLAQDVVVLRRIPAQPLPQRLPGGVGVGEGDVPQEPARLLQVDDAPVGEPGDHEPGDAGQGRLVVEGRGEDRARLGEEALLLLGLPARRHVEHRPDRANGAAPVVARDVRPVDDGGVGAVGPPHAILGRPDLLPVVDRALQAPDETGAVVGVETTGPPGPGALDRRPRLLGRVPEDGRQRLVPGHLAGVDVPVPDDVVHRPRGEPVPGLARAERVLHPLALGDVGHGEEAAAHLARLVEDRGRPLEELAHRPVGPDHVELHIRDAHAPGGGHLHRQLLRRELAAIPIQPERRPLGRRGALREVAPRRHPQHPLECRVAGDVAALAVVGQGDPDRDQVEQRLELRDAALERPVGRRELLEQLRALGVGPLPVDRERHLVGDRLDEFDLVGFEPPALPGAEGKRPEEPAARDQGTAHVGLDAERADAPDGRVRGGLDVLHHEPRPAPGDQAAHPLAEAEPLDRPGHPVRNPGARVEPQRLAVLGHPVVEVDLQREVRREHLVEATERRSGLLLREEHERRAGQERKVRVRLSCARIGALRVHVTILVGRARWVAGCERRFCRQICRPSNRCPGLQADNPPWNRAAF